VAFDSTDDGPPGPANPVLAEFRARCAELEAPRVLELGTKRSQPTRSTLHDVWVPNAAEFLGADIEGGEDVDIVADVHRLSAVTGEERFDVIVSCSTFEHLKYPHLAAHELMKALEVGGLLYVQTHQTFPLHGFPHDYFRFSREALAGLFGTQMGMRVVSTGYEYPAIVVSPSDPGAIQHDAFLNVSLFAEKTAPTPATYRYELDLA
jgi:hypothetical protein